MTVWEQKTMPKWEFLIMMYTVCAFKSNTQNPFHFHSVLLFHLFLFYFILFVFAYASQFNFSMLCWCLQIRFWTFFAAQTLWKLFIKKKKKKHYENCMTTAAMSLACTYTLEWEAQFPSICLSHKPIWCVRIHLPGDWQSSDMQRHGKMGTKF